MMYARIVQVSLNDGAAAGAADYYRDSMGPTLKKQDGFLNSRFLVDSENARCLLVTLWKTQEARTGAETDGLLQNILQEMKEYFAGPPTVDYYEVVGEVV